MPDSEKPYLVTYQVPSIIGPILKHVECYGRDEVYEAVKDLRPSHDAKLYRKLDLEIQTTIVIDELLGEEESK